MTGWDRDVVRAFMPAVACWLAAAGGLAWLELLPGAAAGGGLAPPLRWAVGLLLVAAVGHGGRVSWRLWHARQAPVQGGSVDAVPIEARQRPA